MSKHPVEDSNHSGNATIDSIIQSRFSRRSVVLGGLSATVASSFLGSLVLTGCSSNNGNDNTSGIDNEIPDSVLALGFAAVPKSLADRVVLPTGYSASVLYALGDPLAADLSDYANDGSDDGHWNRRAGDHHDAMAYYPLPRGSTSSDRGLLAINHEEITEVYFHANGPTVDAEGLRPPAEVLKEQYAIGVAVVEIRKTDGQWAVVRNSPFNKRWHVNSPMEITGPARGSSLLTTPLSGDGIATFGTINNCGSGVTPWGTYLTGEENFFAYFTVNDASSDTDELKRYGIASGARLFNYKDWDKAENPGGLQLRFNISRLGTSEREDFRNEPNHFGYVVEIDPYAPEATPKKRTAIGRFSHEGAWFAPTVAGQPLVCYSGDDARNEYIYKYVSAAVWDPADAAGGLDMGDKYLDRGTLYAAKFNDDGSGDWLPLTTANPALNGMTAADIAVFTRIAADRAGATRMDRPEWGAVNPNNREVYFALTNSSSSSSGRGQGGAGSSPRDAANPRSYSADGNPAQASGNINGHIIRWRESPGLITFAWDIYAFGARSSYGDAQVNISALDDDNDFSSPDGLWFDRRGILWVQTDDGAYTDVTNSMMLAAVPGTVGDGAAVDVAGEDGLSVTTFAGAAPGDKLRRFLVGVPGSEITGVDVTPDHRAMFVNIQHPGEFGTLESLQSSWPNPSGDALVDAMAGQRPRTATIVITRDDGGEIGV
jgi:secreted PhoX family phosphatase